MLADMKNNDFQTHISAQYYVLMLHDCHYSNSNMDKTLLVWKVWKFLGKTPPTSRQPHLKTLRNKCPAVWMYAVLEISTPLSTQQTYIHEELNTSCALHCKTTWSRNRGQGGATCSLTWKQSFSPWTESQSVFIYSTVPRSDFGETAA